jgi:hypothetical protein
MALEVERAIFRGLRMVGVANVALLSAVVGKVHVTARGRDHAVTDGFAVDPIVFCDAD